jgi:hypothetical protein
MPSALHLLKDGASPLALRTIEQEAARGDAVTVVLLHTALAPRLPSAATVRRVPADMTYDQLLDAIFAADRVIAW